MEDRIKQCDFLDFFLTLSLTVEVHLWGTSHTSHPFKWDNLQNIWMLNIFGPSVNVTYIYDATIKNISFIHLQNEQMQRSYLYQNP